MAGPKDLAGLMLQRGMHHNQQQKHVCTHSLHTVRMYTGLGMLYGMTKGTDTQQPGLASCEAMQSGGQ